MTLAGGNIELRGAIDRIDSDGEDALRVVDYKTGTDSQFAPDNGVFHGGRRLQHTIYSWAAQVMCETTVAAAEYHFPTTRGENRVHGFGAQELVSGPALIDRLLDMVRDGSFLPTDSSGDCRLCDFHASCGVRPLGYGEVASPRAEWGRRAFEELEEYRPLREVRLWEE